MRRDLHLRIPTDRVSMGENWQPMGNDGAAQWLIWAIGGAAHLVGMGVGGQPMDPTFCDVRYQANENPLQTKKVFFLLSVRFKFFVCSKAKKRQTTLTRYQSVAKLAEATSASFHATQERAVATLGLFLVSTIPFLRNLATASFSQQFHGLSALLR